MLMLWMLLLLFKLSSLLFSLLWVLAKKQHVSPPSQSFLLCALQHPSSVLEQPRRKPSVATAPSY